MVSNKVRDNLITQPDILYCFLKSRFPYQIFTLNTQVWIHYAKKKKIEIELKVVKVSIYHNEK